MIEKIFGRVIAKTDKSISIRMNECIDLTVTAKISDFEMEKNIEVFIHWHWNSETGPVLYGFIDQFAKDAFKILITCPKIGPSSALSILNQISASTLFEMIAEENEKMLSKISGIGPKSAKNMINYLKDQAIDFISKNISSTSTTLNSSFLLRDVQEALFSLGYSSSEISQTINQLKTNSNATQTFDNLLRAGLMIIQKQKN